MNRVVSKAIQLFTKVNVWLYRRTNGRVAGTGAGGLPVLLLTVPGRKSGARHTVPAVYFDHNSGYLVVGTGLGGSHKTPSWFLNLAAAGRARIRIKDEDREVDAQIASGAERDSLWSEVADRAPHFVKWQERAGRMFPIAVLTPRYLRG